MKSLRDRGFHSAHPTGWTESISGIGVCVCVRHHIEDDHYFCSLASQTPITIHILKAYDESYSKIMREHKYKENEDNDKGKDTDKVSETPNICYFS